MERSFRIYYGDGTTYEGDPFEAPGSNVQVVIVAWDGPRGWRKVQGKDFYLWMGYLGWRGSDMSGVIDYFHHYKGPQKVLLGRTIHDEVYQAISRRASAEGLG